MSGCPVCQRPIKARGLCSTHYRAALRAGLTVRPTKRIPALTRWAKGHDACDDCGTTETRHQGRGLCVTCYTEDVRLERAARASEERIVKWKLEIGEYRTREGLRARVLAVDLLPGSVGKTATGIICPPGGDWFPAAWNSDGFYYSTDQSGHDLIAPWRDPVSLERWVNIFADGPSHYLYASRIQADECAGRDRIACVRVTGTEEME